jgi:ABC-type glycerol-3-phosphate transport system substrate-binding protein
MLAVGGLAGCAGRAAGRSASPAPTVQQPKIVLGMRAWGVGSGAVGNPKTIDALLYEATAPWRAKHPGVDIRIIENTGGPPAVISAILAGTGPDIYHSWHPSVMLAGEEYAADLTPYLRQANADLSVFNKAQMDVFITPRGVRALPYYLGIMALAVNETLLDNLGLEYPGPGWTHQDYARLATAVARGSTGTKKLYGSNFSLGMFGELPYLPPDCILQGFGGSIVAPADQTRCNLAAPASVQAVEWTYGLVWSGAFTGPGTSADFTRNLAMNWAPSFFLPQAATGWTGFKWHYYPTPSFPVTGPTTGCTSDLWAMNPQTKYPDLAWDLLHWCAFEPDWQRSQMDIFLLSPALLTLWDEWLTRVPQIAPPLADKNLKAFVDLARSNRAYPKPFFRYQASQAENLMNTWAQSMLNRQVDVRLGLSQLAAQIDTLQKLGAQEEQVARAAGQRFPTQGPAVAPVPPGI